jgi:uncharacterized protein (DUF433 family)
LDFFPLREPASPPTPAHTHVIEKYIIRLSDPRWLGLGPLHPASRSKPAKRSGQPCVRGLRITVWDVLTWLAGGMTEQEILDDYPELEPDDFRAVYEFAAGMGRRVAL